MKNLVGEEKSILEWIVFAFSVVLLLAVVSFLVLDARRDDGRPPEIEVTLGAPATSPHGYVIPVAAVNNGDETAQDVVIEVSTDGSPPEQAEIQIPFLSSGEMRRGWVGFSGSSEGLEFEPRVKGYRVD